MPVDWNLAAVAVAIVALLLTPTGVILSRKVISILQSKFRPKTGLYERFEWFDLDDHILHTCTIPDQNCAHHETMSIMEFFSWKKDRKLVKKPSLLHLKTSYIRTDTKTLRAFVSLLHRDELRLVFEEVGTLLTASVTLDPASKLQYLRTGSSFFRIQVSKKEMDLVSQGYSPWYQDPLSLANGSRVPHPIQENADMYRGGWIVAIGLSPTPPITFAFLGLEGGEKMQKHVLRALERIKHRLKNLFQIFRDPKIETAIGLVNLARSVVKGSCSQSRFNEQSSRYSLKLGFEMYWYERDTQLGFAETLTDNDCILAMQIFNQYEDLSDSQKLSLEGILMSTIRATLLGVYQVAIFDPLCGWEILQEKLPSDLLSDRRVYLYREHRNFDD
jgi:hypothetical protein